MKITVFYINLDLEMVIKKKKNIFHLLASTINH